MTDFEILRTNDALRKRNAFLKHERDEARALLRLVAHTDVKVPDEMAQVLIQIADYLAEVDGGE